MPPEGLPWLAKDELMSFEEIVRVASVLTECGIQSFKLTGGEPTILRPGSITRGRIEAVVGCVREFIGHVERHLGALLDAIPDAMFRLSRARATVPSPSTGCCSAWPADANT